jgi:hypothetical protein
MQTHEIIWRIVYWVGILVIAAWGIREIIRQRKSLNRRERMRITFKWVGILLLFTFVCLIACPRGFITYGGNWWVRGQIVERETGRPVEGVYVIFDFYRSDFNDFKYQQLVNERFKTLKGQLGPGEKPSGITLRGITDRDGRFITRAIFMSGYVPFGYPLWGSPRGKNTWMLIRKEGYRQEIIGYRTTRWHQAKHFMGKPEDEGEFNDVGIAYLSKEVKK